MHRNVVREHIDPLALAERVRLDEAIEILSAIDAYYEDRSGDEGSVLTSLVIALADPSPRHERLIRY